MANDPTHAAAATARSFWPVAIISAFAVFLAGCIGFVLYAIRQQTDLVSPDYYAQELRHQEQMERVARTQGVQSQIKVAFDSTRQSLSLNLPIEHARLTPAGEIHFYRPSAAGLDRREKLRVNDQGAQNLDASTLEPGLWRVRVTWIAGSQQYFWDEKIVIPKKP